MRQGDDAAHGKPASEQRGRQPKAGRPGCLRTCQCQADVAAALRDVEIGVGRHADVARSDSHGSRSVTDHDAATEIQRVTRLSGAIPRGLRNSHIAFDVPHGPDRAISTISRSANARRLLNSVIRPNGCNSSELDNSAKDNYCSKLHVFLPQPPQTHYAFAFCVYTPTARPT